MQREGKGENPSLLSAFKKKAHVRKTQPIKKSYLGSERLICLLTTKFDDFLAS
jgi:hypothetical protein